MKKIQEISNYWAERARPFEVEQCNWSSLIGFIGYDKVDSEAGNWVGEKYRVAIFKVTPKPKP